LRRRRLRRGRGRLMIALVLAAAIAASSGAGPDPAVARQIVAETAIAQGEKMDASGDPAPRDWAGVVRFAYAAALRRPAPERVVAGLWVDSRGRSSAFADAETLLGGGNFVALGRDEAARRGLESGDLVAYRQGGADDPVYHLMIVVAPEDPAHAGPLVVYHP